MISGENPWLKDYKVEKQSYFFLNGGIWGWASWRRAWAHYDFKMKLWQTEEGKNAVRYFLGETGFRTMAEPFDQTYRGEIDTWDYQWAFARHIQSGLSINPCRNLVSNIGFGHVDATHTQTNYDAPKVFELDFPLRHPNYVVLDGDFGPAYAKVQKKEQPFNIRKYVPKPFKRLVKIILSKFQSNCSF